MVRRSILTGLLGILAYFSFPRAKAQDVIIPSQQGILDKLQDPRAFSFFISNISMMDLLLRRVLLKQHDDVETLENLAVKFFQQKYDESEREGRMRYHRGRKLFHDLLTKLWNNRDQFINKLQEMNPGEIEQIGVKAQSYVLPMRDMLMEFGIVDQGFAEELSEDTIAFTQLAAADELRINEYDESYILVICRIFPFSYFCRED